MAGFASGVGQNWGAPWSWIRRGNLGRFLGFPQSSPVGQPGYLSSLLSGPGTSGYWPFQTPRPGSTVLDPQTGFAGETVNRIWSAEPEGVMETMPTLRYPSAASGLPFWATLRIAEISQETGTDWLEQLRNLPLSSIPSWFWNALHAAWGKSVKDQIPEAERKPRPAEAPMPEAPPSPEAETLYTVTTASNIPGGPPVGQTITGGQIAAIAAAMGVSVGTVIGLLGAQPATAVFTAEATTTPETGPTGPLPVPPPLPVPEPTPPVITGGTPPPAPGVPATPPYTTPSTTGGSPISDLASALGRALSGQQQGGIPGLGSSGNLGGASALRSLFEMAPYIGKGVPTLGQLLAAGR